MALVRLHLGLCLWTEQCTWADIRRAAEQAERAGWDSIWVWDHLLPVHGRGPQILEAWTSLAALAACTERIQLGTLVSPMTFRNAGVLANMADTVRRISEDRLVLGVGAGWYETEHELFGLPMAKRFTRFERGLSVLKARLEELDTIDADSPRPSIPLLIGGSGGTAVSMAIQHANYINVHPPLDNVLRVKKLLDRGDGVKPTPAISVTIPATDGFMVRTHREAALRAISDAHLESRHQPWPATLAGPVDAQAMQLRPYVREGVRHIVMELIPPFDHETIHSNRELRTVLERLA